jgi:hypothetical protein
MFYCLTNQHLEHWFHFLLEIKQVIVSIEYLSSLLMSLLIWNVGCIWRSVDEIVWLDLVFINHVLMVTQILPQVGRLVDINLIILLLIMNFILSHLILLSPYSYFFPPLALISLFHLLFLNKGWVWLHVDWDDECSKGVASDHTTIIHDILGCNLTIKLTVKYF